MTLYANLTRQLTGDEGNKPTVYKDSLGYWTIGIGRLVDPKKPGGGLRPSEIAFMLANDIDEREQALLTHLPWITSLSEERQAVLINMSFQMGVEGLLAFKNTLAMVKAFNFEAAAAGMLQSKWATQTPERAERLAKQMRTGTWQFTPGT